MAERYISQIGSKKIPHNAGNKARMLRFLIGKKCNVPLTIAIRSGIEVQKMYARLPEETSDSEGWVAKEESS